MRVRVRTLAYPGGLWARPNSPRRRTIFLHSAPTPARPSCSGLGVIVFCLVRTRCFRSADTPCRPSTHRGTRFGRKDLDRGSCTGGLGLRRPCRGGWSRELLRIANSLSSSKVCPTAILWVLLLLFANINNSPVFSSERGILCLRDGQTIRKHSLKMWIGWDDVDNKL